MTENQKEPHPEEPGRTADGRFAEGNNLGGLTQKGRATYVGRADALDAKYDSVDKLMALFVTDATTGRRSPGPELLAMHPRDAAIIIQNMGSIFGDDKRGERESYYDRVEGKPMQRNEFSGPNGGAITHADANQARDILLGRGVRSTTAGTADGAPGEADGSPTNKPAV